MRSGKATLWQAATGIALGSALAPVSTGQTAAAANADRAFVAALDEAWSSGEPQRVLELFRCCLHPQVRSEIGGRVQMSTGGRPVDRKSEIGPSFAHGAHRALHLTARVAMSGPRPARASWFEVLVLRVEGDKRHGLLLAETTAAYQAAVKSSCGAGSPIGEGLRASCQACNYEIAAPRGEWAMVVRDPQTSGCLEGFEIWALDRDLACELTVHATTADDVVPMPETLQLACAALAHGCGQAPPECTPVPLAIEGLEGMQGRFDLSAFGEKRRFVLRTLRCGPIAYVLAVQGAPRVLERSPDTIDDLLATLRVLDTKRPPDPARVLAAHRGGSFEGATYRQPDLGLELTGPRAMRTFERLGTTRFQAGWSCPITGSYLLVAGQDRKEAPWSLEAARAWMASWVRGQRDCAATPLVPSSPPEQIEVAAHPAWRLRYARGKAPVTRGFLLAIPHGGTLVTVQGEATPCEYQEQILAALATCESLLRLAPLPDGGSKK